MAVGLEEDWEEAGLAAGDTVLIHSSIKRTIQRLKAKGRPADPQLVLQSLLNVLGDQGTLLLPLFNFDFPKTKFFDIRSTPSQMGALTEAGRLHPDAVRTGHPIDSFAVIGKHRALFDGLDNQSGYGADSPFGLLRQLDGKIGVIDLEDQYSMTFYHHVEQMVGVDYRYLKEFTGTYVDREGNVSQRTYSLLVRYLEQGVESYAWPMEKMFWDEGYYSGHRPMEKSGLRLIKANRMFQRMKRQIVSGKAEGVIYRRNPHAC